MKIPVYTREQVFGAIKREGLGPNAYRFKTPNCIYIFDVAMENDEIWDDLPTPLVGFEHADWDANRLEAVKYFILEGYSQNGIETLEYTLDRLNKK